MENYVPLDRFQSTSLNAIEEAVKNYLFLSLPSQTHIYLDAYYSSPDILGSPQLVPIDPQYFPFEIAKILPRRVESPLNMPPLSSPLMLPHENDPNTPNMLELTPSDDSSLSHSNFPFTHYQPHLKKQKRIPVYKKNLSFFSISHHDMAQNSDINENNSPEENQKNGVINNEENTIDCSPEYIQEKEKEKPEVEEEDPEESHNPQPRELVFEFSDSFLQNPVCSDINPCSKKDRGLNRKIHWKKMTPELFQEIYIWEKKQLALQNKIHLLSLEKKYERSLSSGPPNNNN